ncbi:MAG: ABC transporter permease [Deltaproteobacteria bacterium]|nr:ABC transporter permease [Deltaproteobacteria bacterium]MCL5792834.1 ABC transporter permease [Deltaproteobacteria bacterium]
MKSHSLLRPVIKKEFIQIIRDPISLAVVILIPIIQLLLFGYAVSFDIKHIPMGIFDQSHTQESRQLIRAVTASSYFLIADNANSRTEINTLIEKGDIKIGIIIPPDFADNINADKTAGVQLLIDGTDANVGGVALGYFIAAAQGYSLDITKRMLNKQGDSSLSRNFPLLSQRLRIWYNQTLRTENFIVPGLIATILMILGVLMTSQSVAREYERGTMEQLIVSPVKVYELIIGKLVPYIVIGFIQVTLVTLIAVLVFHVPLKGNLLLLTLTTFLFLVSAMGIGFLFSAITKSQQVAMQMSFVGTMLPSLLLSGFIYPINSMPLALRIFSYVVPAKYFLVVLRGIFLKNSSMFVLMPQILIMILISVIVLTLCILKTKKSLD